MNKTGRTPVEDLDFSSTFGEMHPVSIFLPCIFIYLFSLLVTQTELYGFVWCLADYFCM